MGQSCPVAIGKRRERAHIRGICMSERNLITPEDRQLLETLRGLSDRQLLLLVALVVLKDSRIRETVLAALA